MRKILLLGIVPLFLFSVAFAVFTDQNLIPDWAVTPIKALVQKGVLKGNDDGSFAPQRSINRAEFCKIMILATGVTIQQVQKSSFPDVQTTDWFFNYVQTAKSYDWLSGYPDGTFKPGNTINRAEAAKIMANAFGFNIPAQGSNETWSDPYFKALSNNGLLAYGTTLQNLGASENPTRAEIAEQVYRFLVKSGKITATDIANLPQDPSPVDTSDASLESFFYNYVDNTVNTMLIDPTAGTLYLSKTPGYPEQLDVPQGQPGITVLSLDATTKTADKVKVKSLKFRRIGGGKTSDFTTAWLEIDNILISSKVKITGDVIQIPFLRPQTFGSEVKTIMLKVNVSPTAQTEKTSRFVLYLPSWLDSNTRNKVGFFPFGGSDITVQIN